MQIKLVTTILLLGIITLVFYNGAIDPRFCVWTGQSGDVWVVNESFPISTPPALVNSKIVESILPSYILPTLAESNCPIRAFVLRLLPNRLLNSMFIQKSIERILDFHKNKNLHLLLTVKEKGILYLSNVNKFPYPHHVFKKINSFQLQKLTEDRTFIINDETLSEFKFDDRVYKVIPNQGIDHESFYQWTLFNTGIGKIKCESTRTKCTSSYEPITKNFKDLFRLTPSNEVASNCLSLVMENITKLNYETREAPANPSALLHCAARSNQILQLLMASWSYECPPHRDLFTNISKMYLKRNRLTLLLAEEAAECAIKLGTKELENLIRFRELSDSRYVVQTYFNVKPNTQQTLQILSAQSKVNFPLPSWWGIDPIGRYQKHNESVRKFSVMLEATDFGSLKDEISNLGRSRVREFVREYRALHSQNFEPFLKALYFYRMTHSILSHSDLDRIIETLNLDSRLIGFSYNAKRNHILNSLN